MGGEGRGSLLEEGWLWSMSDRYVHVYVHVYVYAYVYVYVYVITKNDV